MTDREAIDVLFNEWKCIDRNDGIHCDRKCESCDLVMDVGIIREAFNMAIKALEAQEWIPVSERLPEKYGEYRITRNAPTIEPERKKGKWQITDAYPHNVYCSECHTRFAQTHWSVWEDGSLPRNFCPNCGADMREEDA